MEEEISYSSLITKHFFFLSLLQIFYISPVGSIFLHEKVDCMKF